MEVLRKSRENSLGGRWGVLRFGNNGIVMRNKEWLQWLRVFEFCVRGLVRLCAGVWILEQGYRH